MKILPTIFRFFLLIVLLFASDLLLAQNEETFHRTDVVYLKNGSVFRGQIESYEVGGILKLRLDKTKLLIFKAKNIKKIVQEATEEEQKNKVFTPKKEYQFKEKGLFFASSIGYIGGNEQFGNYVDGFNAHFQSGYQFHRLVGIGLGVGVDFYNVNLGSMVPIYSEVRGYFKASNVSPFYSIATGIGLPITNENSNFSDKKPGLYLAPALGIRFGGSSEANMTVALGLQWQKAKYSQPPNDVITRLEDTYTFRRFHFKVGLVF